MNEADKEECTDIGLSESNLVLAALEDVDVILEITEELGDELVSSSEMLEEIVEEA